MSASDYRILADIVLITHVAFVAFVVLGLLAILVGGACGWNWIRNPWFRAGHLAAIGVVVVQAWLGVICPLTTIELWLREHSGEPTYNGSFIAHWLQKLLYFEAPDWVFVAGYTVFGLAVIGSWLKFRPRPFRYRAN
jgi:multisubunit Na+/H+ antiporter MnhB subunit